MNQLWKWGSSVAAAAMLAACGQQGEVGTSAGGDDDVAEAFRAEAMSRDFLLARRDALGIARDELKVRAQEIDREVQLTHTRFTQLHRGVRVFGAEVIAHARLGGAVADLTDGLVGGLDVDPVPTLSREQAIDAAIAAHGCGDCLTSLPEAELNVLRHEGADRLVYRVQLRQEDGTEHTTLPVLFVDAHAGDVVWRYENMQTASGTSLYSGNVAINTYFKSGTYYMEDLSRKLGTFDMRNGTMNTYRFTDTDDVWNSSTQQAGVDAHFGAATVYDYFLNVHGRRGIDGNGGPVYFTSADGVTGLISSRVHYGRRYNNAFWNGSVMTYGDGDGSQFGPLVTLDICGHEMMHGITERTANLTYSNESGALNESWSDVFGAMVERHARGESANTWRIGEETYTPATAGDALRYMDNPHLAGNYGYTTNDDPDHYSERYTGTGDSGGVHINSGIANHAFYLLAKGGTHHLGGSMTGIGADAAARIWYKALTSYMTPSTNFAGARVATMNAAAALYGAGSTQHTAVGQAWSLVGVN